MTPVRAKDKLFLAAVLPAAAVAAYLWLWRIPCAKRLDALSRESAALVSRDAFDGEMRAAAARRAAAERELAAERAVPPPVLRVKADARASAAERERGVLAVFKECGIGVMRAEDASGRLSEDAAQALKAAGLVAEPAARRYVLDGAYPAVRSALGAFAAREMAVVPERVEMRENGRGRWTLVLWR